MATCWLCFAPPPMGGMADLAYHAHDIDHIGLLPGELVRQMGVCIVRPAEIRIRYDPSTDTIIQEPYTPPAAAAEKKTGRRSTIARPWRELAVPSDEEDGELVTATECLSCP